MSRPGDRHDYGLRAAPCPAGVREARRRRFPSSRNRSSGTRPPSSSGSSRSRCRTPARPSSATSTSPPASSRARSSRPSSPPTVPRSIPIRPSPAPSTTASRKLQDDYIRTRDMLVDRGLHRQRSASSASPARLIIEKANANIAAMQHILYYPATAEELDDFEPTVTVIYTPNLQGRGLSGRAADRGRPRELHHPRLQLRLLRRVEEGRPADVEQARVRARRPGAPRGLQGHPGRTARSASA